MSVRIGYLFLLWILVAGCGDEEQAAPVLTILSSSVNGQALTDGMTIVGTSVEIAVVFSAALDPIRVESALSLQTVSGATTDYSIRYENAQTRAIIIATLDFNTSYILSISNDPIGQQNEALATPLSIDFTTMEDGTVRSMPPCTGTADCLLTKTFNEDSQPSDFSFYSSYPIYLDDAAWEKLKYAVIVIHGQNRDADNYFSFLTSTLGTLGMQDSTILLAPYFKETADTPDDLFWPTTRSWREGRIDGSAARISSFTVIDSLILQLHDKTRFPVLEKVIVTGHSSGGLFTHLYGASNVSENEYGTTGFDYIPANSQYYYYPTGLRYDEDNGVFYEPGGCIGYDLWPLGFNSVPSYVSGTPESTYNDQFATRKITYLLGNGTGADGSLNTTDCEATLLGTTRYSRGENIYRFMNEFYPDQHVHQRTIVEGVGHNGAQMYSSMEFAELLEQILQ